MKKILLLLGVLLFSTSAFAQTEEYERKYNLLVSKLGPAGVGIENLINNWEKADSVNEKMLVAKFTYYFTKSQSYQVVSKQEKKYLGMDPVLTLKDSLGRPVYYFQEPVFDDALFGKSLSATQKLVSLFPDKLDYRFLEATAYLQYEADSPDLALEYLTELAKEDAERTRPWVFEGEKVDDWFFADAMQEYCFSLYNIGSDKSLEAFKTISELMLKLNPTSYQYLNNIGSYHMVEGEDYKAALKCYGKVLKKDPNDVIALQNSVVAYRKLGNTKKEKAYIERLNRLKIDN